MKRFIAPPLALTLVFALGMSGCSWAFSRPPRHTPRSMCQPSYAAPVFDTSQAIGGGVLTLAALAHASNDQYESEADTFGLIGALFGITSAAYAASAHYGFKQARACREQREQIARNGTMWIAPHVPAYPPPAPAPYPGGSTLESESDSWPLEVEQHVDVDENQIDVHTTIRRVPRPRR